MAGSTADRAKGRVKEAIGDLTDDQRMKAEGKRDQGAAGVKEGAENARDKVEHAADEIKDKVVDLVDRAKEHTS